MTNIVYRTQRWAGLVGDDNVTATRVATMDGDVPQLASGTATPKAGGYESG
jgi:hypothetical protein